MRFLLLLLLGCCIRPSLSAPATCVLYELPTPAIGTCESLLEWATHDDEDALAVCLDYFPTTFVKGKRLSATQIKCTVKSAFQCNEPGSFNMFDKCYKFIYNPANKTYMGGTMPAYLDKKAKAPLCGTGQLSMLYSSTQARFLAMKARQHGIRKLWIALDKDGKSLVDGKLHMRKLWKVVEGDYWDGYVLTQGSSPDAKYYFLRTKMDYVNNRRAGSFERANHKVIASFACEFPVSFVDDQQWYCDKQRVLGIDSVYDRESGRCLYLSASRFTFDGTKKGLKQITACQERPSPLHSSGLDDGSATPAAYSAFKSNAGKLRLAGFLTHDVHGLGTKWLPKCNATLPDPDDSWQRKNLALGWLHLTHQGNEQFPYVSRLIWDRAYPLNECSDLPGESSTLGLLKGNLVDLPRELRLRAVCSISFFAECELRTERDGVNPCGKWMECTNSKQYSTANKGFFTCACPDNFATKGRDCIWQSTPIQCAKMFFYNAPGLVQLDPAFIETTKYRSLLSDGFEAYNDRLNKIVVRKNCRVTVGSKGRENIWVPRKATDPEVDIVRDAGYGSHIVPQRDSGTLGGALGDMGASGANCTCTD